MSREELIQCARARKPLAPDETPKADRLLSHWSKFVLESMSYGIRGIGLRIGGLPTGQGFAKVLPLDRLHVEDGRLEFEDLGVKYGFASPRQYVLEWSRFDHLSMKHSPIEKGCGRSLPEEVLTAPGDAYFSVRISADSTNRAVTAYFRRQASGIRVVGIDRTW